MRNFYVGFGTASEWLKEVDQSLPVNVECVIDRSKPGSHGIALASQVVVLSQVKGNEVLYLQAPVDRYQTLDGYPIADEDRHAARAKSALDGPSGGWRPTASGTARAWLRCPGPSGW